MGRKCGISECSSDSARPEDIGVTFHKVPNHSTVRPKWLSLCRIPEDTPGSRLIYICSRHFLRADFCNFKGKKYMLRQGVLPSVFPWNKSDVKHGKKDPGKKSSKNAATSGSAPSADASSLKKETAGGDNKETSGADAKTSSKSGNTLGETASTDNSSKPNASVDPSGNPSSCGNTSNQSSCGVSSDISSSSGTMNSGTRSSGKPSTSKGSSADAKSSTGKSGSSNPKVSLSSTKGSTSTSKNTPVSKARASTGKGTPAAEKRTPSSRTNEKRSTEAVKATSKDANSTVRTDKKESISCNTHKPKEESELSVEKALEKTSIQNQSLVKIDLNNADLSTIKVDPAIVKGYPSLLTSSPVVKVDKIAIKADLNDKNNLQEVVSIESSNEDSKDELSLIKDEIASYLDSKKKMLDSGLQSGDSGKQSSDSTKKSPDSTKKSPDPTNKTSDSIKQPSDSSKRSPHSSKQSSDSTKQSPHSSKQSSAPTESPDSNNQILEPNKQLEAGEQPLDSGAQSINSEKQSLDSLKASLEFEGPIEVKKEPESDLTALTIQTDPATFETAAVKDEVLSPNQSTTIEQKIKTVETPTGLLTFAPNTRIEALDFNQVWCPAKIVEVDYQENEVLVHFEKYSSKYDEWICMNSLGLRALQDAPAAPTAKKPSEGFQVGERCMASWSDSRKFPATINKVLENDLYEVLFDDGFVKAMRSHRISKSQPKTMQSSPLFNPVSGSKQERRDRKRKINVTALFNKKKRAVGQEDKPVAQVEAGPSSVEDVNYWTPQWEHGKPVGEESIIETFDGPRKSVIVPDPRIPPNWQKHLTQRIHGASAGKWDTVIVSPDGRRFRARSEIKAYLDERPELNLSDSLFDFSLHRRTRRNESSKRPQPPPPPPAETPQPVEAPPEVEESTDTQNSLKILVVDNAYKCPIEGCGKNFRRENLAQMHVKHYHPEYTKFLDFTPNVADLAYARTVGESLDRSPGPEKSTRSQQTKSSKSSTPKLYPSKSANSPSVDYEPKNQKKDSEIVRLLNKPYDSSKADDSTSVLPSGLPANMYPEIKLKDLLNKSEGLPKRDDINLKALSAVRPPGGIKTLLPVVRSEVKREHDSKPSKSTSKKKKLYSEYDAIKPKEEVNVKMEPLPPAEPGSVIIEGGEVIKIVRMKREEIINCTCGITEEDGLMIQCELCLCWQHAYCNNIERENQVPEKYICYICQNPAKQRTSRKYFHDQDWLKHGTLPVGNYHCKDEEVLNNRFEKLKKSHDLSGGLLELNDFLHTLKVKIKIAKAKNHPKLYLWSKPWDKPPLPEVDSKDDIKMEIKEESQSSSMLLSLLKGKEDDQKLPEFSKIDINTIIEDNLEQITAAPIIPQPEAAIESDDCRINLLDHISHYQSLVEQRLAAFEDRINALDVEPPCDTDENFPKIRHTTEMIMRDINTLNEFIQMNSL